MLESRKQKIIKRLPALLLMAVTLLFWGLYERYEAAGPILLQEPSMADATRLRGECAETNSHFTLRVLPGGKPASINFRLTDAVDYGRIRVQGRMKLDGVVVGKNPWRCARLLLVQYDFHDKWIPGHHGVVAEQGTLGWDAYEDVFELDAHAAHVDLVIQQTGREGSAEFDRLVAEPVRLRSSFHWWRIIFAVAWISMAVLYFRRCRLHRRKLRVLILLNAVAIILGTMMPERWIEDSARHAQKEVTRAIEKPHRSSETAPAGQPARSSDAVEIIEQFSEKVGGLHVIGHFALFASLCFLIYLSAALEHQPRTYFFKVAFDVLLFAGITESLQYVTLDRNPGINDWFIDLYGMAAAFVCFLIVLAIFPFRPEAVRD
jgi:hypothetical protein